MKKNAAALGKKKLFELTVEKISHVKYAFCTIARLHDCIFRRSWGNSDIRGNIGGLYNYILLYIIYYKHNASLGEEKMQSCKNAIMHFGGITLSPFRDINASPFTTSPRCSLGLRHFANIVTFRGKNDNIVTFSNKMTIFREHGIMVVTLQRNQLKEPPPTPPRGRERQAEARTAKTPNSEL